MKFLFSKIFNRVILISLLICGVIGFVLGSWAFYFEPNSLVVKDYEIKIENLNAAFEGLKIIAISDIHGGSNGVTEEKIREVVRQANAQNADLIVLLGDFVSQNNFNRKKLKMPMTTIAENLKGLKAKYGVFAVLGNHDVWDNQEFITSELEKIGYPVLWDKIAPVEIKGKTLYILGLREAVTIKGGWQPYSDKLKEVLREANADENVLVLAHNPDLFPIVTEVNMKIPFKLMLAGHTHGGQCDFPLIGAPVVPSSYGQRYNKGHIFEEGYHLFVTSGIGTSILPIRFRVPPEISVVTIKNAN